MISYSQLGHDFDKRCDRQLKDIESLLIPQEKVLIKKYYRVLVNDGKKVTTQVKNLNRILAFCRFWEQRSWKQITKDEVDEIVFQIMQKYGKNGETTVTTDTKKVLRMWLRYVKLGYRDREEAKRQTGQEDPVEALGIKNKNVESKIAKEDLITKEDLVKMLENALNVRDSALIHVLWDSGCRIGEILTLEIKDVKSDKNGLLLAVDGKTGDRLVRLHESIPNLSKWINAHPYKDDPAAPLWINIGATNFGELLKYPAVNRMLQKVCKRAGIKKRIYPHLFRHTEATKTAKFLTNPLTAKRHGWSPNSKMPSHYAHLNQDDVDEQFLKHYGIEPSQEEQVTAAPVICPICRHPNSFDSVLCDNCGKPMSKEGSLMHEAEIEAKFEKQLDKVMEAFSAAKPYFEMVKQIQTLIPEDKRNADSVAIPVKEIPQELREQMIRALKF